MGIMKVLKPIYQELRSESLLQNVFTVKSRNETRRLMKWYGTVCPNILMLDGKLLKPVYMMLFHNLI